MSRWEEGHVDLKFSDLLSSLRQAGSAVLAFSGGVDSSFLLKTMKESGMRFLAVTSHSETMPERDLNRAVSFAKETGAEHLLIDAKELLNESFASNPPDRCFYCKDALFKTLSEIARERGYQHLFDGTNRDDLHDYRPGLKAAAKYNVRSPLSECGFSKTDVRRISEKLGLKYWDRPSSPCLASRFPYGRRITAHGLRQVEKAEEFLKGLGLTDVRVRNHGEIALIEVKEREMDILLSPDNKVLLIEHLKSLGFSYVSLDLEGYVSGSLNRSLAKNPAAALTASD